MNAAATDPSAASAADADTPVESAAGITADTAAGTRVADASRPRVTVVLLSYQQKPLLRAALDSALAQVTDFPFEVLVCDDASTDGTPELLREYAARHSEAMRLVLHERNLGAYENYVDAHNRARGDYVAHLDGDDLFLPGKLQRQVDFMDAHPEVSVSWHAMRLVDDDERELGTIDMRREVFPDGRIVLEDALELGSVGVHSAMLYRREARTTFRPDVDPIDWYYAVEYLAHGEGFQLPETLGVYRRLEGVSMSNAPDTMRRMRREYARMVSSHARRFPQHRRRLFTLSLLFFASDVYARSANARFTLGPLMRTVSLPSPRRFSRAYRRFRAMSRAFRGVAGP